MVVAPLDWMRGKRAASPTATAAMMTATARLGRGNPSDRWELRLVLSRVAKGSLPS
jgi:hypothetical protein